MYMYKYTKFTFSAGHTGKRFILMIPEGGSSTADVPIEVIISTEHNTNVTLTSPYPGVSRTLTVQPPGTKITLPPGIALKGTGIQQKGILVESSMDVSVYVFHEDGYYALPSRYLLKPNLRFRVTDTGHNGDAMCAIAPINGAAIVEYTFLKNGTNEQVKIPMYSVFYLRSRWAMADVIVASNAPIALLAGHYRSFTINYQNQMEYLLPMAYWDKRYIVPRIQNATNSYDYLYPMDRRSTSYEKIRNSVQSIELPISGNWEYIYSPNVYSNFIRANDSISLIEWLNTGSLFNSFMTIIPGLSQYSNNYRFATPSYQGQHFVAVIVQAEDSEGLTVDGFGMLMPKSNYTVSTFSGEKYFVLTLEITSGWHVIRHIDPYVKFGLIMYGGNKIIAYGLPLGIRLDWIARLLNSHSLICTCTSWLLYSK